MKLGEALSKLKIEKGTLARMLQHRRENLVVYEGEEPSFDPKELTNDINKKLKEIRELKLGIQKANMENKISGQDKTIAEALIEINDIRSELASLKTLFYKRDRLFRREKDELKEIQLMDEKELEQEIQRLQSEKSKLDDQLQMTNWSLELNSFVHK